MRRFLIGLSLLVAGCAPPSGAADDDAGGVDCTYPEDPVHPMAIDEVLFPYEWPTAIHVGDGRTSPLAVEDMACATSDDIDWSPFDVLLFVSIPAW